MLREIHTPANEREWLDLRAMDVTSTQVAALFGLSPYLTEFELYHRVMNKELVDEFVGNKFTKWGNRLEPVIAAGIAEDQNWKIRPMKEYINMPDHRLGASFDFLITEPEEAILEIKNVFGMIFQDQWITEDGAIEAPPHIEIQNQVQLLVSGKKKLYTGALVSGNQIKLLKREKDEELAAQIIEAVEKFWWRIKKKVEPKINFIQDSEFISKLYGYAEPNKLMDARDNTALLYLAERYRVAAAKGKAATAQKKALKSQILIEIGDHEKCIGDGYSISAGMIAPTTVEQYEKQGYRNFKVNFKKKKTTGEAAT